MAVDSVHPVPCTLLVTTRGPEIWVKCCPSKRTSTITPVMLIEEVVLVTMAQSGLEEIDYLWCSSRLDGRPLLAHRQVLVRICP
jgi:hypothetical protein